MRKRLLLVPLAASTCAAVAAAATGTVTVTLKPNEVSAASAATVIAKGPFPTVSGFPKSAMLEVQDGFKSSAKSVAVLCTNADEKSGNCPSKSKVGSGSANVTGTYSFFTQQDTIELALFLGVPRHSGDIASVEVEGHDTDFGQSAHVVGRLFVPHEGGLELLFSQLPTFKAPAGTKITLNKLTLTAHAVRTVASGAHTVRYSLIKNPATCNGHWSGSVKVTFTSGSLSRSLSVACTS
jgi:hypothetical protein